MSDVGLERFVLGVDLDGVVADYPGGFAPYAAQATGVQVEDLVARSSYNFDEWGLDKETYEELHKFAVVEDRLLSKLPVIDGCAEALWRLSDLGVWIRVITHRLYVNWGHAETVTDTVNWLDEHQIPYRDICFLGNKPEVGADCYIDDAPHNVEALRAHDCYVITYDQSYNAELDPPRARNWVEAEQLIFDRYVEWSGPRGVEVPLPGLEREDTARIARNRAHLV